MTKPRVERASCVYKTLESALDSFGDDALHKLMLYIALQYLTVSAELRQETAKK